MHFMDEQLFTLRGEMPGMIPVQARGECPELPMKVVPTILEGELMVCSENDH
jgi:hypothetical protein